MRGHVLVVIKGIGLWFSIFLLSTIVGSLLVGVTHNALVGAISIQILFIVLSIAFVKLALRNRFSIIGFQIPSSTYILISFILSITFSILIAYVEIIVAGHEEPISPIPEIVIGSPFYYLLAFILAPAGEETLFRGLLVGYIVEETATNPWIPILLSATLFSTTHLIPFSTAPPIQKAFVVSTAFILSTIAGYLRIKSSSILPAITVHLCFNLGGYLVSSIT